MECSRDSEIIHEIVRDTTRISSCFHDFRVVSRTISCIISESPPLFISILTVYSRTIASYRVSSEATL